MVDANALQHLRGVPIDREVTAEEVRQALASLLAVQSGQVDGVRDYGDLDPEEGIKAYCHVARLKSGDFTALLSIGSRSGMPAGDAQVAVNLYGPLGCRALVADGSENPYMCLLVDGSGRCQKVSLDVDRWANNEYVIVAGRRTS